MLQVYEVTTYKEFLSLRERWNSLVEKSSINSAFLTHEWFRCWWDSYGQGNQLLILLFQEEGVLKCIVPLMISKVLFRGLPVRKISFIENDENPHCGVIEDSSYDISCIIDAMVNHLNSTSESRWDIIMLRKINKDSRLIKILSDSFKSRGYDAVINSTLRSPVLYINTDWNSFYAGKSQRFKKKIRYDRNKLKREGNITTRVFDTPEQIESIIEEVFAVGCRSWKGKDGNSVGSTPQNRSFFSQLPKALSNTKNKVLLWTLSLDEKIISFEYHVGQGHTVYALRGEFDAEYQGGSPGAVLDGEVVHHLFEKGIQTYDMCGDSADLYKLRWTSDVRPYQELIAFRRGIYPKILAFLEMHIIPIIMPYYLKIIKKRHLLPW
ncbi:MAG: GNAT family N-acetyltransferase [Candidatus Electrothrix sp. AR4]|nr:GNAT family N-acetyltransferase [Candidatus Electrothrix sp. AR4]